MVLYANMYQTDGQTATGCKLVYIGCPLNGEMRDLLEGTSLRCLCRLG